LGLIKSKEESDFCRRLVERLRVKTATIDVPVNSLSGGNQQKVSLAKWFGISLKLIILDEPTRGIDVGAKVEVYKLINELAHQGLGVIMISSEMMEIIGMCDRAAVMHRGKMIGILERDELTEENIMRLATGEEKNNEKK
ncbi:MAG: ribose transport system ATP-binding protein, partial [Candidatus Atribacteria bacterium]|nr:ribose transport system ATP-binding protein [Candidatus Atribacteria bacterium]